MNDWYGLGFLVLLVLGAYLFLRQLSKPKKLTPEEFERRAAEGGGFSKVLVLELQKILNPTEKKSVEVMQDLKGGKYNKKQAKGDDENTDDAEKDS
ncbi:MAG TPA: hypothetical protein VF571_16485 [Pyrinomonadaceae bacterium]|jgi:hypothetical protein